MLTNLQLRNGLVNPLSRWRNGEVPFVIDRVFGEYCAPTYKLVCGAWREISIHEYRFISIAHWMMGGRSNGDNYVWLPLKIITHSYIHTHTHTSKQPCNLIHDPQIYTGCPRRNVPDFGRVLLMLKYTDITQNTYIQS